MSEPTTHSVLKRLDQLRIELIELAFSLECRGRLDAADVAMTTSARVGELCEEFLATASAVVPADAGRADPARSTS